MRLKRISHYICQFGSYALIFSTGLLIGITLNWDQCHESHSLETESASHDVIGTDDTYMIIVIFSAFTNDDRRNAIRNSWILLGDGRKLKHYFIIGTLDLNDNELSVLYDEQNMHNDLILFPHLKDTYSALTLKLLTTLKWFSNKHNFKYLLKVDDDSFVRIDNLFDEMLEMSITFSDRLYMGYFDGRAHIKKGGQWSEKNWVLCDRYLPYAIGGGYVLSHGLVKLIASNADMLQVYRNEDVSLGVWLSPFNVKRVHDIRFDTEYESRGCLNSHIITHKQSADNMKILYHNLKSFGKLCLKELRLKNAYEYNWKVPPSLCCVRNITL